ncbi:hypothetical protein niasHS_007212 [Heterodera schachtii]|uniref:Methyltransferase HEMK2 n=1 Tax=Heterodera schachtii TaxID=97005 RepID=A0ABD2JJT0_HETSC
MTAHLATPDYQIDHPSVYPPSEDTFLLLDALEAEQARIKAIAPRICVEIGCGSGVVSAFLNKLLTNASSSASDNAGGSEENCQFCTICIDVNLYALHCTQKTFEKMDESASIAHNRTKKPLMVCCNLLDPLAHRLKHGGVDILLMNPPYVPTEQTAQNEQELCYAGGPSGRALLDRLLPNVADILSPNGLFYLVALKENGVDELISTTTRERLGIEGTVVMERQCRNEHLFVLRFTHANVETAVPTTAGPSSAPTAKLPVATTAAETPSPAGSGNTPKTPSKITIHLRPVGSAPQLEAQYRKLVTNSGQSIAHITRVLRKWLGLGPTDSLFLFVNETFAPFPEHTIGNLYECFGSHDSRKLYLQYCLTPAWG